ncbi:hypothetical protein BHM03_00033306 [Ensete ventricosum]|nr:hypothetical protein BHM03_00033306 [Ensete ventricosum]
MGLALLTRVLFNTVKASEKKGGRMKPVEHLVTRRGWCSQDLIRCTTDKVYHITAVLSSPVTSSLMGFTYLLSLVKTFGFSLVLRSEFSSELKHSPLHS